MKNQMKKEYYQNFESFWEVFFFVAIFILVSALLTAQGTVKAGKNNQENTPTIKEFVEVINMEMTVRALSKGKPVGGLLQSDFILKENGKELKITSFTEVRRKIGEKQVVELEEGDPMHTRAKKRFFLLYFWLRELDVKYRESLDYFFNNVYRDDDLVLMVVSNKAIKITSPDDIPGALEQLEQEIRFQGKNWLTWIRNTVKRLEDDFKDYIDALMNPEYYTNLESLREKIVRDLEESWKEYQFRYLTSNVTKLSNLAEAIKEIPLEKWGIVYHQLSPFPLFEIDQVRQVISHYSAKEAQELVALLEPYRFITKLPNNGRVHVKSIQDAFIRANATFHLIQPDSEFHLEFDSNILRMADVYSNWEDSFRNIAKATGGEIIGGNILKASMQKVVDREDVFYRITYRPRESKKENRQITINSKIPSITLYHVSKVKVAAPKYIELVDVSIDDSILSLTVKNYHLVAMAEQQIGDVQLVITVTNEDGETMEMMKQLQLKSEEATVSMKLNLPKNTTHTLLITAWDNLSGLKAEKTLTINAFGEQRAAAPY